MKKLLILGASGHGKVIANVAYDCDKWSEISFLDDNKNIGTSLIGFKVIDSIYNLDLYIHDYICIVGIGDNYIRENITKRLQTLGADIATIIHPSAVIGLDVNIGIGSVIMPMAVINTSVSIGEGCVVNTGATIDHDCELGSFVHASPGVTIAGTVKVGDRTWLGAGATVINNISVTKDCIIGAGSTVLKDLDKSGLYIGTPAIMDSKTKNKELYIS